MKMKSKILLSMVTISLLTNISLQEKSQPGKPKSVEPLLWCNSCQAIVREMLKKLKYKTKSFQVEEAYEDICNYKNFNVYEFPPPDMRKGCEKFISVYEEEIIEGLSGRKDNEAVEHEICFKSTKACVGVEGAQKQDL